jgi:hypothetical protein
MKNVFFGVQILPPAHEHTHSENCRLCNGDGGGGGDDAATSVLIPWIFVVRNDCILLHPAVMICKHLQLHGQF